MAANYKYKIADARFTRKHINIAGSHTPVSLAAQAVPDAGFGQ